MLMAALYDFSKYECQTVRNIYKFKNFSMVQNPPFSINPTHISSTASDKQDNIILQSDIWQAR